MWFADFKTEKIQLASFDGSNNSGTTDVKKDRSVFAGAITLCLLLKLPLEKMELRFVLSRSFHLRFLLTSINLQLSIFEYVE